MTSLPDIQQIESDLIRQTASVLGMNEQNISPQTELSSLGLDSIRLIEVLIFIEQQYGIKMMEAGLDSESLKNIVSLAARVAELKSKLDE